MILTSLICRMTHNSHAPARDNNNPTLPSRTERPRHMCSWEPTRRTHQTFVVMRRSYDFCVEFSVAIHGHGPCAVNSTCVASTDVEPCSIVSLKSGISVTPPNLGSRCIALAKPTIKINVHHSIKLLLAQWVSRA